MSLATDRICLNKKCNAYTLLQDNHCEALDKIINCKRKITEKSI